MADLLRFIPVRRETLARIRARLDADVNAGVDPESDAFVDATPGGFYWDVTQGLALEVEKLWDVATLDTVAASFVEHAWGAYLDLHGATINVPRKAAVQATGELTFTGDNGLMVAIGAEVSTVQTDAEEEPQTFQTTAAGTVAGGTLTLSAQAVEAGPLGNVAAAAITVLASGGLEDLAVTNAAAFTGGASVESDEDYRARLKLEYAAAQGAGSVSDYMRWALAYPGVGNVRVVPIWQGPGSVRVVVTDENNDPVSIAVRDGLQDQIDPYVAQTLLKGSHTFADATVEVDSTVGFASTGTIMVSDQEITYTGVIVTGTDEVQSLTVDATGGTYTATFDGQTTTALAPGATDAAVQAALEALSNIDVGDVVVTGGPGGAGGGTPYVITFQGALATTNVPEITTTPSLTGGAGTAIVTTTTPGVSPQFTGATGGTGTFPDDTAVVQHGYGEGLAPVGAAATVSTPALLNITVAANVTYDDGYSVDGDDGTVALRDQIEEALVEYIDSLGPGGEDPPGVESPAGSGFVLLNRVESRFFLIEGVYNVASVTLNGAGANVAVGTLQVPTLVRPTTLT